MNEFSPQALETLELIGPCPECKHPMVHHRGAGELVFDVDGEGQALSEQVKAGAATGGFTGCFHERFDSASLRCRCRVTRWSSR